MSLPARTIDCFVYQLRFWYLFLLVQGPPPAHNRFDDPRVPKHITYAYKERAVIRENKDFYTLPKGETDKTIDILFLIANAPVSTVSLPITGSQPYVGMAVAMQHATEALSKKFPSFFAER